MRYGRNGAPPDSWTVHDPEDDGDLDEDLDDVPDKEFDPSQDYTNYELMEWADKLLKQDAARELCRKCKDNSDTIPYGKETGHIESVPQYTPDGEPIVDDEGNLLYVDYPELECEKGHRWYKGEGPRRNINGANPILFDSHYYNRQRREIYTEQGVPDPAYTMDRFGRPIQGMYNRVHPDGRKMNTSEQRKKNGASFTGSCSLGLGTDLEVGLKPRLLQIFTVNFKEA